jgi:hypothetical protein
MVDWYFDRGLHGLLDSFLAMAATVAGNIPSCSAISCVMAVAVRRCREIFRIRDGADDAPQAPARDLGAGRSGEISLGSLPLTAVEP